MNTVVTSRERILDCALELARQKGVSALDMRGVAAACGVAVGSLYNYFPSKGDLMIATVGEIWKEIFNAGERAAVGKDFCADVEQLFEAAKLGSKKYPSFFTAHARMFSESDKTQARRGMSEMFSHIRMGLMHTLKSDANVRADAFNDEFSPDDFVNFVFSHMTALLIMGADSCDMLQKVIRRAIY